MKVRMTWDQIKSDMQNQIQKAEEALKKQNEEVLNEPQTKEALDAIKSLNTKDQIREITTSESGFGKSSTIYFNFSKLII